MEEKLKVAWICHFSNAEIQNQIKPRKRRSEFAPWITLGIEEVKKRPKEFELHIVSPHRWISKIKEFQEGNIFYHFFNYGIPLYGHEWPEYFRWDAYTSYSSNRKKIKKIINSIKPDIIHWHGAENGYFTSSFFDLGDKYPHLVTIQGFISLVFNRFLGMDNKINYAYKKRDIIEKKILTSAKNFGVRDNFMKNEVLKYNSDANFYWHEYFINIPEKEADFLIEEEKKYDIIFYSRVVKSKGIEDLIKAIGIIKKTLPNVRLVIIGNSVSNYIEFLRKLVIENNCLANIEFRGFLPTQSEIYKILRQTKVFVLPAYIGDVSGGMIESMTRKIPVVSYKTGGINEVNLQGHNIELVEQGNIDEIASKILFLLENPFYAKELAERAYKYAASRWDKQKALNNILFAYNKILKKNN